MKNRVWIIDEKETKSSGGSVLKWDDERFFTLTFNGKEFFGEILEEKSEDHKLKIKINHRVFEVKKQGELDELIAALGLDVQKVRKLYARHYASYENAMAHSNSRSADWIYIKTIELTEDTI